jgi:hypothetical protein
MSKDKERSMTKSSVKPCGIWSPPDWFCGSPREWRCALLGVLSWFGLYSFLALGMLMAVAFGALGYAGGIYLWSGVNSWGWALAGVTQGWFASMLMHKRMERWVLRRAGLIWARHGGSERLSEIKKAMRAGLSSLSSMGSDEMSRLGLGREWAAMWTVEKACDAGIEALASKQSPDLIHAKEAAMRRAQSAIVEASPEAHAIAQKLILIEEVDEMVKQKKRSSRAL